MSQMKVAMIVATMLLLSFALITTAENECERCHQDVVDVFNTSLHHTATGMYDEYELYAMDHFGLDTETYYEEKNCQKCHVQSCTQCHIGEDVYDVHTKEVSSDACEPCHAKKQCSTYAGEFPKHKPCDGDADIHYDRGLSCTDCHGVNDLHGDGNVYETQLQAVEVTCEECHMDPERVVDGMTPTPYTFEPEAHGIHVGKVDCNACHSSWMLTCQSCHIETRKGMTVSSEEFYLAKDKDGLVSAFMKMETAATIANNTTHTIYAEWHPHTTSPGAECDFCHDDASIYVSADNTFGGEGGSGFTQEEIDMIMNTEMPTETEPGIGIVETIRNWIRGLMG